MPAAGRGAWATRALLCAAAGISIWAGCKAPDRTEPTPDAHVAGSVDREANGVEDAAPVFSSFEPIHQIAWSPIDASFVYICGDMLMDWPAGRRVKLPSLFETGDAGTGSDYVQIHMSEDGRFAVISSLGKRSFIVVDLRRFTVTRAEGASFAAVWWRRQQLCRSTPDRVNDFPAGSRSAIRCGDQVRTGPRGKYLAAVSPDGRAALVRTPLKQPIGKIEVVTLSPDMSSVRRRWVVLHRYDLSNVADVDWIAWNAKLQSAAVLVSTATDGGIGTGLVAIAQGARAREVRSTGDWFIFGKGLPHWLDNRVLVGLRLWRERTTKTSGGVPILKREDEYELALIDPETFTYEILWGGGRLGPAAPSHDGDLIAYVEEVAGNFYSLFVARPDDLRRRLGPLKRRILSERVPPGHYQPAH